MKLRVYIYVLGRIHNPNYTRNLFYTIERKTKHDFSQFFSTISLQIAFLICLKSLNLTIEIDLLDKYVHSIALNPT